VRVRACVYVGVATDHGLDNQMITVRTPTAVGIFSLRYCVQTDSGAHSASYPIGTGGPFPGGKAAEA
jgi:hypothetical protein